MTGAQGSQGAKGDQGDKGDKGDQGDPGKAAIVTWINASGVEEYRELLCVEMPEVRFEDLVSVRLVEPSRTIRIDDLFFDVCDEGTIMPVSLVPSLPVPCGARVSGRMLIVEAVLGANKSLDVVVRLSGIRKGCSGKRFASHTREEMIKNNAFWQRWRET